MSIKLLSDVWDYDITGNARTVVQVLCDHASDDGVCWPSNDVVAYKVGISKRQVQNILGELRSRGVIEALETGGYGPKSTNKVRVNLSVLPVKKREIAISPIKGEKDELAASLLAKGEKGEISLHKGEISTPKGEIAISPEPSIEPSIEPSEITPPSPLKNRKHKPLPQHGPAQQIVAAYCQVAGIEKPAMYGRAVKNAQDLADFGITPEDIPGLYRYVAKWAKGVDLGLMLRQADRYQASRKSEVQEVVHPGRASIEYLLAMDDWGGWMPDEYREEVRAYRASH